MKLLGGKASKGNCWVVKLVNDIVGVVCTPDWRGERGRVSSERWGVSSVSVLSRVKSDRSSTLEVG